jgi:tetratricopeptide (TPR) repeat protein
MPSGITIKIIAASLIGFFLFIPHPTSAQGLFEASDLNERAIQLGNAGRYFEAELLYKQSLAIREKVLGPNHSEVAASLNNLVLLYGKQGRYSEAIPLARRALTIDEEALGPDRPKVASLLNNLAEPKVATPMPNLFANAHWRYARKCWVPTILMSRFR